MRVVGLDISLTRTGLALIEDGHWTEIETVTSTGKKGATYDEFLIRIEEVGHDIRSVLNAWRRKGGIDLAVIEAPSHGSKFGNPHERAGLWWNVYSTLYNLRAPIVTVAPATRAKYITGSGRADKKVVLAHAIARYVTEDTPRLRYDDEADALGLADMGARHLNEGLVPNDLMPADHLQSMEVVKWTT